jgi:hypothetical protein
MKRLRVVPGVDAVLLAKLTITLSVASIENVERLHLLRPMFAPTQQ